jgi:hypothetical protein
MVLVHLFRNLNRPQPPSLPTSSLVSHLNRGYVGFKVDKAAVGNVRQSEALEQKIYYSS